MKTYLGLDIGSANIKVVEVVKEGKGIKVVNAGLSPTPPRVFLSEAEADQEELGKTIKILLRDSKIKTKEVNVSLLESQVITRVISTPKLSDKELTQALRWEAEQYIPLPLDEVNIDFVVLERDEKEEKMQVLLVAAPLTLVNKYMNIFESAGLEVKALESEGVALCRLFERREENILLANLGALSSSFYILKKGVLILSRSIAGGGAVLTKALHSELNLTQGQAEEYKKAYGLDSSQMEGKVALVLGPLVNTLISEMAQGLTFFREKYEEEIMNRVVLTGGEALLPHFASYLQEKLGLEVSLGNPWQNFVLDKKVAGQFSGQETLFSVATGMAVRDIDITIER